MIPCGVTAPGKPTDASHLGRVPDVRSVNQGGVEGNIGARV